MEFGFSLVEAMISTAVVAGLLLAVMNTNLIMAKSAEKAPLRSGIDNFRLSLVSLVNNDSAWAKTVSYPANQGMMSCLIPSGGSGGGTFDTCKLHPEWCSGGGGGSFGDTLKNGTPTPTPTATPGSGSGGGDLLGPKPTPTPAPTPGPTPIDTGSVCLLHPDWCGTGGGGGGGSGVSCPNVGAAAAQPFVLLDAQGNVFFDATNVANGITQAGKKCGPHATDPALKSYSFPSAECPYTFSLKWFATAAANAPTVGVDVQLGFSPNINPLQLQPERYSVPTIFRRAQ